MPSHAPEKSPPYQTGFAFHDCFLEHVLERGHPESPARLAAIIDALKSDGLSDALRPVTPLEDEKAIADAILRVHSNVHFASVKKCGDATARAACGAVAHALGAVTHVMRGDMRNAFCAVRPPGHHAHNNGADYDGPGQGQGFCFLNNVAIAARYAQNVLGCGNVLIVDWDYHHGNGTEWAFYDDPTVFFFSTHALLTYPGTGYPERRGSGMGRGYNLNVPLRPFAEDADIINAWEHGLVTAIKELGFRPDIVLISAGFDSREDDVLGNFQITDAGFARLTQIAMEIADEHCGGRIVSVLEGGYTPEGLAKAVVAHVRALNGVME